MKKRYIEKIAYVGIDPFAIPAQNFSSESLPSIEPCDILSYLVLETSFYTKDQFKNYRSLQAYNQLVSGFVSSVLGGVINDKHVVIAKVRHSQRMNDPHVPLWIIVTNDGPILSAHCSGCMAGLGECCSLIASVLFYVKCWARIHGKLACTEVKCAWLLPSTVKDIRYSKAKDINFTAATKLKSDLDTSIDNLGCVQSEENQKLARSVAKCIGPTQNELNDFLHSLNKCKTKPVCLSLADPYYKSFISTNRNIKTVPELFQKSFMDISYPELLKKCNEVEIKLTENEIFAIERDTFDQAAGKSFFRHRAGRIGASRCHAVCHTDPAKPSQSLIKSICYPDVFNFSTKATRHGCQHEAFAISS